MFRKTIDLNKIFLFSLIIHFIVSIFSIGFYHFDEHFQILEFANYKSGGTTQGNLAWEFHDQIRSAIQPAIAYVTILFLKFTGLANPFTQAFVLRLFSLIISLVSITFLIKTFEANFRNARLNKWLYYLSFYLWFLVFLHIRYSSETWSGALFIIGLCLYLKNKEAGKARLILSGFILALSFVFRFQTGLMILGFGFWLLFIKKENFRNLVFLFSGFLLASAFGIIIDKWFYGEWTLTSWNYFNVNILQNKQAHFGVYPWWYYFTEFFYKAFPPFNILLLFSMLIFWIYKPKNVLTWITFTFISVHFLVGHKELRFLFPIVNFLPLIFVLSLAEINTNENLKKLNSILNNHSWEWLKKLFWISNLAFLIIICFKPADNLCSLYKFIYENYRNSKTQLFYLKNNPYKRVDRTVCFYKNSNLTIDKYESKFIKPNNDAITLLVVDQLNLPDSLRSKSLNFQKVYQNIPDWVTKFNFNHWVERTNLISVYEVR